jgi:hypothetical protein
LIRQLVQKVFALIGDIFVVNLERMNGFLTIASTFFSTRNGALKNPQLRLTFASRVKGWRLDLGPVACCLSVSYESASIP